MQRTLIITLVGLLILGGMALTASSQIPSDCTWVGTTERDVKTGTSGPNILCALGGDDFLHGRGGRDRIRAGAGQDSVVGGKGRDILKGGAGPDKLFSVDERGGERIVGGAGIDRCFVDPGDHVFGCERLFRSDEPQMAGAYDSSLGTVMTIIEGGLPPIEPTVTVTQPAVTVTETETVNFPPCSPPPNVVPAPC
jgi:hypothetical protein